MSNLPRIEINPFPFYWRIKSEKTNHISIPEELPYTLTIDPTLNLIIEERNEALLDTLHLMYQQESNIGFLQDGHTLANSYGDDFFVVIERLVNQYNINNALEIGCGGCYLLQKIRKIGVDGVGVDPSPIAHRKGSEKGIKVINSFYPAPDLTDVYDLIYHVDVLEHVSNPVDFLKTHHGNLATNGIIIVNVPDNTRSIELGDISLASHQHLNNFDIYSLFATLEAADFKVVDIIKSSFGGSLYGVACKKNSKIVSEYAARSDSSIATNFFSKAHSNIERFRSFTDDLTNSGSTLGFYMPLRAFPYLSIGNLSDKVRLFDDISHWHNSYIGSSQVPIENIHDLFNNPVNHLFIMSHSFGHGLKNKILKMLPNQRITLLSDFLVDNQCY